MRRIFLVMFMTSVRVNMTDFENEDLELDSALHR